MPEMTVSDEDRFLIWAHGGSNVFLTGAGGVGKSYLTRIFIRQRKEKRLSLAVTASTGVAAILVGGSTIHSWAGIELGPTREESFDEAADRLMARPYRAARRAEERVRSISCVLIDEISMLPGRILSFLDFWFRRLRSDPRPFGGCQMIFVGDFLQLSPVRKDQREPYDWAFQAPVWKECLDKSILLETIRRQTDQTFIRALSAVRVGRLSAPEVRVLRDRVLENPERDTPRLMTHNLAVDKWCDLMLSDIEEPPVVFEATTQGAPEAVEALAKNILAPATLTLKVGALVMHLVNKTYTLEGGRELYVVNGALGTVVQIFPDEAGHGGGAVLRMADGDHMVFIEPHSYSWSHLPPDKGGPEFCQLPLRLAWALTIHKAQGMTIDRAHIDIRAAREPGQTYVALSRVRTLDGLSLKEWPSGAFVSPQAIRFYQDLSPSRGECAQTPRGAVQMVQPAQSSPAPALAWLAPTVASPEPTLL